MFHVEQTIRDKPVDVVVIGGGHAGVEAAAAAARCGAITVLITMRADMIGAMSCNPSIGGLGKGHIVREIDALDGIMARAADEASIHYRMLNRSKGAAVRGPRVQADRRRYAASVKRLLSASGCTVVEGEVERFLLLGGNISGVQMMSGEIIETRSIVVATGTFLNARLFRGNEREPGGRWGESGTPALAEQFRDFGLPLGRLKTGTPPRLDGRSIDWAALDRQPSDEEQWTLSLLTERRLLPQVDCAVTHTTAETHELVLAGAAASPILSGAIQASGPRYCPSLEDKVVRFADRKSHQIFLEPEGLDTGIVYPNGLSTSLPAAMQERIIHSIPGLQRAEITQPGYAVEYDHIDPRYLSSTLMVTGIPGLFCAGQINGTTGYEEAAGQGLVAGLNAAALALDKAPAVLDRASSYIGVMTDDLTLQGVTEPYRMLTARAEFRLSLRADNAWARLDLMGRHMGCLSAARMRANDRRASSIEALSSELDSRVDAVAASRSGMSVNVNGAPKSLFDWLAHPDASLAALAPALIQRYDRETIDYVTQEARYAPYIARQAGDMARLRASEALLLSSTLDYRSIAGLSSEMVQRLGAARPASLAAASRVRGITPAALTAILLHSRRAAA